jgi:glycosyltransferase involved in cell wall biosynthesis
MRILQFVADGAPGGGTNHVFQLLTGLGAEYECSLLTQQESYLADKATDAGIEVRTGDFFRSRVDPGSVRSLKQAIREYQPDLIHCHGGRAAFFKSFVFTKTPSVYTVHGFHFARKPTWARRMGWFGEYWTIRRTENMLFVCDYDRRLAKTTQLLPSEKPFDVIYNGIPEPKPIGTEPKNLGIGFIGRMVTQKHPEQFVEMMSQLPGARGVMVGGGPLEPEVRALVKKHGLEDRLELLGSLGHEAALEVLANLDVLVMTPRWEGLPLLPLEAMYLGVPVVSTAVGGIPEIINHGETGLLAKNNTVAELAELTQNITSNKELRTSIVERAREVVADRFAQETMIRRVEECYAKSLGERSSVAGAAAATAWSATEQGVLE